MAAAEGQWVLMATGRTPTNIAVIKYWGKRDEALILPINDSISVTLDPDHLSATTTVAVSPSFPSDRMWLNGKEISLLGGRFQSCLREIRKRARDFEDKEKGVKIKKEDWDKLHVHIASYNNFPTAAGLASSAAGLACFVFTLGKLMNAKEDYGELSSIARQGSGSACRSIYGGFVKWCMGEKDDGSDSIAVQLADETHWNDLVIIIAVVSSKQKETSSTSGMRDSVETSPLLQYRAQTVVPGRVLKMEEAIKNRDFESFAKLTCADSNQFHAVCLDTSPPIFYMNDTSHRIISLVEKWNHSEGTPQVAYTFDAGPNAVLIAQNRKTAAHLLQKLLYYFPPQDNDLSSYLVGDKSILGVAGLHSMKDVEALPAPPETKIPDQKFKGDVSYFICSRLGAGPKVVSDEGQALIDSVTGLPKGV
ncbi:diphosphomevalonate decarboxylase MVD2, peroxisomal isoform X1 [Zea mays]|nr:Diphosphomevalonate decarboxylase MVD2, peroxisomal [Zea mays]XP_008643692.1 uncharacterized protein LOC100282878 isoform X1 [Zea mays]ACG34742.1 diphosphomevalonate decarboxylase [Zea mays]ACR36666.1 unknown [Zea mays]AQK75763.1 Diphosphomevalonate decarboxylase MVD2 [Zea mays]AQK75769.1 Diphosphomevalonate decarboxylase MVD2 [Zea mays]AQK75771.1 Diphosphomevalonate decarboxylase MVD2 [Zea mays]|eukprot:NP_001149256.1 uncharacterized protein LOC100282878 [Zea mays]